MDVARRQVVAGLFGAGLGAFGGRLLPRGDTSPSVRPASAGEPYTNVRAYGAVGDGVADDTNAIKAAIEATLGRGATIRAGRILFPKGLYRITDTLTVAQASVSLEGVGWSSSRNIAPETRGSVIAWDGPAGRPMLRLDHCWGTRLSGMRLVGKSTARPSAAVSLRNVRSDPNGSNFNALSSMWIGSLSGFDTDAVEKQFDTGILLEGDNVNGDTNRFEMVAIFNCETGVKLTQQQFVRNHFSMLRIGSCETAFDSNATISTSGDNWVLSHSTRTDIRLGVAARLRIDGFSSEFANRLATTESSSLTIRDGYWQMGPNMTPDGVLIDGRRGAARSYLRLEDFDFTNENARGPGRIVWDPPSQMFMSNVAGP